MRIALALHNGFGFESVKYVARIIREALNHQHETHVLPFARETAEPDQIGSAAAELVMACDVIVGFPVMLAPLLHARKQTKRNIPAVIFALGAFPAGAAVIKRLMPYLDTNDVIVVNSTADLALARKFIGNARIALLPLAYDDTTFKPCTASERHSRRAALGCDDGSRILLCAGRATLEKNVHTTLRVFGGISRVLTDAHLVIAGPVENTPFSEFGVYPLSYRRTLENLASALGIPGDRVHFVGSLNRDDLADAYNVADALINLTLHHDENFGLAQVEANACGTPVIGTAWGGLRDTVRSGITGTKIGTRNTLLGVKINWWEAVAKALAVLDATEDREQGRSRIAATARAYSRSAFRSGLESIVQSAAAEWRPDAIPLQSTAFADLFWACCTSDDHPHALYSRDSYSFELYRQLIAEYVEATDDMVPFDEPVGPRQTLVLLWPVSVQDDSSIAVVDPLYPFEVDIPSQLRHSVPALLATLGEQPAVPVDHLGLVHTVHGKSLEALEWLERLGVVARSRAMTTRVLPHQVSVAMRGLPLRSQRVDVLTCDLLVTGNGAPLPRLVI